MTGARAFVYMPFRRIYRVTFVFRRQYVFQVQTHCDLANVIELCRIHATLSIEKREAFTQTQQQLLLQ